jgi:zeaxanthin glucosyltransferase
MATIAVCPFQWAGNLNTSFGLARKLAQRGHRIHYFCIPDVEDRVRQQGFGFSPILETVFPKGHTEQQKKNESEGKYSTMKDAKREMGGAVEWVASGKVEEAMAPVAPDVIVVSNSLPWVGLSVYRTGLPVAVYSSSLISPRDPQVPPLTSPLAPSMTAFGLRTRMSWMGVKVVKRIFRLFWDQEAYLMKIARASGYPISRIDLVNESFPRLLEYPELVCCPSAFDLPRAIEPPNAFFVEGSVDEEREDAKFPWEKVDAQKPLIYAAAGSMAASMHKEKATRFIQSFLAAMKERPALQGVIALGTGMKPESFEVPANVLAVVEAPQMALLKKAKLMVTHAGLNSVKECILTGVPMVAIPLFFDQFGYAARIDYHGLGETLLLEKAKGPALAERMDRVLSDPRYREATDRMALEFRRLETEGVSANIIEGLIGQKRAAQTLK